MQSVCCTAVYEVISMYLAVLQPYIVRAARFAPMSLALLAILDVTKYHSLLISRYFCEGTVLSAFLDTAHH